MRETRRFKVTFFHGSEELGSKDIAAPDTYEALDKAYGFYEHEKGPFPRGDPMFWYKVEAIDAETA
jgi:hypothetical protein